MAKPLEGFERAFQLVGGHGKFQWFILAVTSLQLMFMTWNHMGYIFIGSVPQHWCKIDELKDTNWNAQQIKSLAIPKIISNGESSEGKFDECHQYDVDYTGLLSRFNGNYDEVFKHMHSGRSNLTVKGCSAWEYDNSVYGSTIVSEFDLVCGRRYLTATIQSSYMIGGLAGTFIFGALNDRVLGRRNAALISILIVLGGGFISALSTSYWTFLAFRVLTAVGTSGCMQSSSILLLEHCDIGSRAKFFGISGSFYGVGYALMPVYAYFIRDWSSLQLSFSITTLILLSYYWLYPESPRWLASSGKDENAIKALNRIAKMNGKQEPKKADLLLIVQSCHKHHPGGSSEKTGILTKLKEILNNFKSLLNSYEGCKRSITVWSLFIIVSFVYYGFAFSTNLTSNPYILVALGGLMEIPACIFPVPLLSIWGRRPTAVLCYVLTGLFALAIAATPSDYETLRVILSCAGKFFIAAVFNVMYLVASEVFPTISRSTGQSSCTIMSRLGSIMAPYVADLLTTVYPDLPCIIFGLVSCIGGVIALLLPEMNNMEMMDQVSELELEPM